MKQTCCCVLLLAAAALASVASAAVVPSSAVSKRELTSLGATSPAHETLGHHELHEEQPKPYNFGYGVKDAHQGLDFNQQESSDGHVVTGQYRVQLPDGRTQVVTYTADWKNGYHANVQYEGEATHPKVAVVASSPHGWAAGLAGLGGSSASSEHGEQHLGVEYSLAGLGGAGGAGGGGSSYSTGSSDHSGGSSKWTPSVHS